MKKKSSTSPKNILKKTFAILAFLIAAWFVCSIFFLSPIRDDVFYRVAPGASVSSVAADMHERGLIKSVGMFKLVAKLMGDKIQSGEYELGRGTSSWEIARKFKRGDVASIAVLIPEGLTVKQIKNLLTDTDTLAGSVECIAGNIDPVCSLKEGDLFPDTYRVARGTNRLDVLRLAMNKMESVKAAWEKSGKKMPASLKSWNEVITLASIVQKETPKASEMPIVASVYMNRLKKKMKLQADPTVVYAVTNGLGDMQGQGLFTGHLRTASPYNTYLNYGLPPAPIANVGRDAIAAVLDPADTNYLFFVADGQGGHKFAMSYEEHKKNQADWREIKKSLNSKK